MNIKSRKRKIKQKYFPTGIYVMITIIGIIGILIFCDSFNRIFSNNSDGMGIEIIVGLFFTLIPLYCWALYFLNIVKKPHEEILLLKKEEGKKICFVDKKGKEYDYDFDKRGLEEGYYTVLKTQKYIYGVLEKTKEEWTQEEKDEYYRATNKYEENGLFVFLLPISYIVLAIGIFLFIISNKYEKISALSIIIVSLFIIIYNFIRKKKIEKTGIEIIDNTGFFKSFDVLRWIIGAIPSGVCAYFLTLVFIQLESPVEKLIVLPFMCILYCVLGYCLAKILRKHKLAKVFKNASVIIFFGYVFVVLTMSTITSIIEKQWIILLITILFFWTITIIVVSSTFTKMKKEKQRKNK